MTGAERIAAERQRQIEQEGWSEEHDTEHRQEQLVRAAACYALPRWLRDRSIWGMPLRRLLWAWDEQWWKPAPTHLSDDPRADRIRELEKAGALIAAEIDRLQAEGERSTTYRVVDAR